MRSQTQGEEHMSKEAMKLARKCQHTDWDTESPVSADSAVAEADDVINLLVAALTKQRKPQQEPVAIALNTGTKQGVKWLKNVEHGEHLYTSPPTLSLAQRQSRSADTWVELTDDEKRSLIKQQCRYTSEASYADHLALLEVTEAKLKEKNT